MPLVRLLRIALFLRLCVGGFLVEPVYKNLGFYGPLADDPEWRLRRLSLVDDYTLELRDIKLSAGNQFVFVAELEGEPPPLGPLNWKQSKLGCSSVPFSLQPGAGLCQVASAGPYTLTLHTPSAPASLALTYQLQALGPLATSLRLVPRSFAVRRRPDPVPVDAIFSQPVEGFGEAGVSVDNGQLLSVTKTTNASFRLLVKPFAGRVQVVVAAGAAVGAADGVPCSGAASSFLFSPSGVLPGDSWGRLTTLVDASKTLPDPHDEEGPRGWFVTPIHGNVLAATGQVSHATSFPPLNCTPWHFIAFPSQAFISLLASRRVVSWLPGACSGAAVWLAAQ